MSRVCQLKYAMSYVRTQQFQKSLRLALRDDTVVAFFTLQTIEKEKCVVDVQLARSIVNGLVHEFEELNLFCLAKLEI